MKCPTIALVSLLSMLALGLVAAGPRSCHAGSLGQLAFAIQVEETSTGDPMVCPLASCPFSEQRDRCEELLHEEADIELNAAETVNDETQVAEDQSTPLDYQHYYEDYGYEYGDEYSDDYDPYGSDDEVAADEVAADDVTAEDVAAAVVDDMELNAAETNNDQQLADEGYDAYYGEYAEEYDYEYEYEYDYGYDDTDYDYDDTDYGYEYESSDENVVEPVVETVVTDAACNDADCQRVCYPNAPECEYRVMNQISDADLVIEAATDYTDEYYDSYYEEYYGEDFQAEADEADETDSAEWYENDYEKYYSQEYYDNLETPAVSEDELATEPSVVEEETAEYNADAVYEDAVYGERFYEDDFYSDARYDCPCPPVVTEEVAHSPDGGIHDAYVAGNCIDERNAEVVDDLPWADEIVEADVAEIDVPAAGEASEYGSDYAEEFFDEQDAELEEELVPLEAEAAACKAHLPIVAAKTMHSKFDVSRLAAQCGSQVAAWTETLAGLGSAVRVAYADLEAGIETR